MAQQDEFVVFTIDDQKYALTLSCVERVLRAVEISHLPGAPSNVRGVINVQGRAVPVLDTRRVLGQPERTLMPDDVFLLVRGDGPTVVLVADDVSPVAEIVQDSIASAEQVLAGAGTVGGVVTDEDGVTVLVTVYRLLSPEDQAELQAALGNIEESDHAG